jgi:hypothetical protein
MRYTNPKKNANIALITRVAVSWSALQLSDTERPKKFNVNNTTTNAYLRNRIT